MPANKTVNPVVAAVNRVSRWFNYVGVGVLALMMLLTVADVFLRYFFNHPILGTLELTEYMMVPVVYLGVAWCAVRRENIKVDIFINRLRYRTRAFLDSITCLLSLIVTIFIAWNNFKEIKNVWDAKRISDLLHIPAYPFYIVLSLGCFLLCIVLLINFIENLAQGVRKQ